jgi:hypothetical protein
VTVPSASSDDAVPSGGSSAFKDQIDRELVRRLGRAVASVDPEFDVEVFEAATAGLGQLELKARIALVAAALAQCLPQAFEQAVQVVDAVLGQPPEAPDGLPAGLIGWDLWPVADWVALAGRDHPDAALELLARLTPWATGEFAIRPFIDDDPAGVHHRLEGWVIERTSTSAAWSPRAPDPSCPGRRSWRPARRIPGTRSICWTDWSTIGPSTCGGRCRTT